MAGFVLVRAIAGEAEILTLAVGRRARRQGARRGRLDGRGAGAAAASGRDDRCSWKSPHDNAAALALYAGAGFGPAGPARRLLQPRGRTPSTRWSCAAILTARGLEPILAFGIASGPSVWTASKSSASRRACA